MIKFQFIPRQYCRIRVNSNPFRNQSTSVPSSSATPKPTFSSSLPPPPPPQQSSKVLPFTLLLVGGTGAGLAGYYYYDPNAEVFRQARTLLGIEQQKSPAPPLAPLNKKLTKGSVGDEKKDGSQSITQQQKVNSKPNILRSEESKQKNAASSSSSVVVPLPAPPAPSPSPKKPVSSSSLSSSSSSSSPSSSGGVGASAAAAGIAANALGSPQVVSGSSGEKGTSNKGGEEVVKDPVAKHVLITALRAQQEALTESHEAKIKVIQSEYDRRLGNATQVIEAERVVELRGKYEKASAALEAIEKGIEARTTQNERAKRLRALWAQVNALHARVNHPEYHSSTVTTIDKKSLLKSIEIPDKFVAQMVDSLPGKPVHSLESLKERFYSEVQPVARSVGLIKEGEGFSIWKYAMGKMFNWGVVEVVRSEGNKPTSSPVQSTTEALDNAKRALDKSDLLSAAIAMNQLSGLPKQVATDWLADARTLLETNQTLFVLMTYAASNNVF